MFDVLEFWTLISYWNNGLFEYNQAYEKCFQNLHYVERHEEHTIAHAIQTSYKKTKVVKSVSFFYQ